MVHQNRSNKRKNASRRSRRKEPELADLETTEFISQRVIHQDYVKLRRDDFNDHDLEVIPEPENSSKGKN